MLRLLINNTSGWIYATWFKGPSFNLFSQSGTDLICNMNVCEHMQKHMQLNAVRGDSGLCKMA